MNVEVKEAERLNLLNTLEVGVKTSIVMLHGGEIGA